MVSRLNEKDNDEMIRLKPPEENIERKNSEICSNQAEVKENSAKDMKLLSNITPIMPLHDENQHNEETIKSFSHHTSSFSHNAEEIIANEKEKMKPIMEIIKRSYEEEQQKIKNKQVLKEAKRKILTVTKFLRTKNLFQKMLKNTAKTDNRLYVMHPELSTLRILIDSLMIILILYDSLYAPYKYFVSFYYPPTTSANYPYFYPEQYSAANMTPEIVIDCLLSLDIISIFFTAYFKKQVLITDFYLIFVHYIKFTFWLDILYVFPFWALAYHLYIIRIVKLYKFFKIIRRIRYILIKIFHLFIKSLKLIHSITNILLFTINLLYIIHYSACIFVFLGQTPVGWIKNQSNILDSEKNDAVNIYIVSVYLLMETFTTIGYGDINPKTITEVLYLMICEVLNVGLFAYLISCIMDIITKMSTDEISFKLQSQVDINSWLLKYNNKIPELLKVKMEKENSTLFEEVKKYFMLYYKNDNLWIKNFSFLKDMRPDIRKELLNHLFYSLFNTFTYFFSQLEDSFKFKVALNLKSKIIEPQEVIISELQESGKNNLKYIYFIGKGTVTLSKENIDICRFDSGSYFGDEYFLSKTAKFTYTNAKGHDMYLFCCPISVINDICSYYEESYIIMLIKTLVRFSKIRTIAEKNQIVFKDKNSEFFKKIYKQKLMKSKYDMEKMIVLSEESVKNDKNVKIVVEKENKGVDGPVIQNIEMRNIATKEMDAPKIEENSEEYRGNPHQIFSKDDIPNEDENNLFGEISKDNSEEIDEFNRNMTMKDDKELEDEDIFDNLNFLDKIDINEDNIGEMVKLETRKEKLKNYNEYLSKLQKKLSFLNYQVDFLKTHYQSVKAKSDKVISVFDQKDKMMFA